MSNKQTEAAFAAAAEELYEGNPKAAAALMADAAASAVDIEQVATVLEQRSAQRAALDKLFADYPEIQADADYAHLADAYVAANVARGGSIADAITLAGEQLGRKFGLGARGTAQGARGSASDSMPTAEENPHEVIAELRRGRVGVSATADDFAEHSVQDPGASAIIDQMRRERLGQQD